MLSGDDLIGEYGVGGELLELARNGFGEGETAYVDGVVLDVPTDSVLLDE